MKKILLILLLMPSLVFGQNPDEWLRQKETQKKYLLQQIASLQIYIGYAKTGYTIASKGLTAVRTIKNGDFNLHRDFIDALGAINPAIKNYGKVAAIIALQIKTIAAAKEMLKGVKDAKQFTADETAQCSGAIQNLLNASLDNIDALLMIVADGRLKLNDAERIKKIDALYADMQDKFSFASAYSEELAMLTVQRMREAKEVEISKLLNGLR